MATPWEKMKRAEPELAALETVARQAGRDNKPWFGVWRDELYERLTRVVGWGFGGQFASARDFERAHHALLMAWAAPDDGRTPAPWDIEDEAAPLPPALLPSSVKG